MDHSIFSTIRRSLVAVLEQYTPAHFLKIASFQIHTRLLFGYHSSCANVEDCPTENEMEEPQHKNGISGIIEHVGSLCKDGLLQGAMGLWFQMDQRGVPTESITYTRLLQGCIKIKALAEGKQVHAHMLETGFKPCIFLHNNLVNMYAKCGSLQNARQVFDKLPEPDMISWNALISGYAQHGFYKDVLSHFLQMTRAGMKPNQFTFASVLSTCANLAILQQGRQVHTHIIRTGFESYVFVGNALVDMYAKCGRIEEARQLFDEIPIQDEGSWNALITGYAQNGYAEEALKLFCEMQQAGLNLNHFTFGSVLKACSSVSAQEHGKQVHARIIKTGFESDVYVGSAILDMYAKCGGVEDALAMFYKMPKRNVVTWNAMIQMQRTGMKPNHFTLSSILRACTSLAVLEHGKQVHVHVIKSRFELDEFVGSALVDMYAKCGIVEDARKWFDKMPKQDIVSWTAMVAGYTQNGHGEEAVKLFRQVLREAMIPDQFTLSSVLSASASIAAQEQGKQVHTYIIKTGYESCVIVGNALIDMYAKCGSIDGACTLFGKMRKRDVVSWSVLISGYAH